MTRIIDARRGDEPIRRGARDISRDGTSNTALQKAMFNHEVLRAIGPQLVPALDRPANNAINVFYHCTPISATAEIRGRGPGGVAVEVVAGMPWKPCATAAEGTPGLLHSELRLPGHER